MAQFIYFLPGFVKMAASADDLIDAGLGYAVAELGIDSNFHTKDGPDGGNGLCLFTQARYGSNPPAHYAPDKQTWRKGPDGKFWVGVLNDAPPGPDDLKRERMIS